MHTIFWRANYVHNSPPEYELCISHKLHRSPILGYLFQVQALKTVIASKYRNDSVRPFGLSRFHSSKNYYAPLIRPCNSFSRTTFPTWTRDDKVPTYHHKKKIILKQFILLLSGPWWFIPHPRTFNVCIFFSEFRLRWIYSAWNDSVANSVTAIPASRQGN